jgi:flavodoxin/formate hydrogenlyase subunit 6/NADH:ubiquinone oxidoreductase subunit I
MAGTAAVGGLGNLLGPLGAIYIRGINARAAEITPTRASRRLKAAIVYYSATGSTFKVAKAICKGLSQTMNCDLLKIKKADPKKMAQYDVIGLGGPIWYFRETANLKLFVQRMPVMEGKPVFLFCSHGSDPIGFFDSLGQSVMKKKMTVIGWNDWYGSVFHVLHMPKPYLTDGHPDSIDLAQAEAFGGEMADRARNFLAGDTASIPDVPQGLDVDPLWLRHDLPEAQHGPRAKTGSAYGDGVDPAITATAKIQIPGSKPYAAADATQAAATPTAMASFGDTGYRARGPAAATGAHKGGATAGRGGGLAAGGSGKPGSGGAAAGAPGGSPGGAGGAAAGPAGSSPGAAGGGSPAGSSPGPMARRLPQIDMKKCAYPRCDACIFACPVDAIDLSLATPGYAAGPRLAIKEACINCSLCERVCVYDALAHEPGRPASTHEYDMSKCTYPQCTLCVDHCPMNCIDFSTRPPKIHTNCEGCDVCWCICPHDAVSIPNLIERHARMRMTPSHPFVKIIEKYEAAGKFRRLVPLDQVGFDHPIYLNANAPRFVLNDDDEASYCYTPCKVEKFHAS